MTPEILRQTSEGGWVPAKPYGFRGPVARLEQLARRLARAVDRVADRMGRFDERGLGR